MLKIHNILQ